MDRAVSVVAAPAAAGAAFEPASPLLARRLGRVLGGALLALAPLLVLIAWGAARAGERTAPALVPLIGGLWLGALAAWKLGEAIGGSRAGRAVFADDAFGKASYVVPAVGVALAGPLSLHALIASPFWLAGVAWGDHDLAHGFDVWVFYALVGTTHVHIAFAIAMALAARRVARGDVVRGVALWPLVLLALVPGALIVFPPAVVWVTGFVLSRAFFRRAAHWSVDDDALRAHARRHG